MASTKEVKALINGTAHIITPHPSWLILAVWTMTGAIATVYNLLGQLDRA